MASLSNFRGSEAEALDVVTSVRFVVEAERRPGNPNTAVPVAAANHAFVAILRADGVLLTVTHIHIMPVLHPLPDVAGHIIYAKTVGLFGTYRMRFVAAVARVPPYGVNVVAATVPLSLTATPAGVLPLGLRRQAVVLAALQIEFSDERLHILPTDRLYRAVVSAAAEVGRVVPHDTPPLALGDFVPADVEVADAGLVRRGLCGVEVIAEGIAHLETAPRHLHELHTGGRVNEGDTVGTTETQYHRQYQEFRHNVRHEVPSTDTFET